MTCHCGAIALYRVGRKGYCRKHKEEATQAMAKNAQRWDLAHGYYEGRAESGAEDHARRMAESRRVK